MRFSFSTVKQVKKCRPNKLCFYASFELSVKIYPKEEEEEGRRKKWKRKKEPKITFTTQIFIFDYVVFKY